MSLPTVSALVAAYDYGDYLEATVESAIAQEYPPELLEVVIVDDGSTDHTPEVARDLVARHGDRVRYVRQENAGYVAATNRAFAEARGEVWAMLDADDVWAPDKTARQVACLDDPDVALVYSDLRLIDAADNLIEPSFFQWTKLPAHRGRAGIGAMTSWGNLATGSSVMVRASLGELIAPIPPEMPYVDWWLAARAADVGAIDYVDAPLVGYRMHGANLTLTASGDSAIRERVKLGLARRFILAHVDLDAMSSHELLAAWAGAERDAAGAVQAASSAFVELGVVGPADAARAVELAARARRLDARGAHDLALAHWVRAAALDPYDPARRRRIRDHAAVESAPGVAEALDGARSFVTVISAADLAYDPGLMRGYAREFGPDDDATLVVVATGWDAQRTAERLGNLLHAIGLDDDARCPDMLAVPDPACGLPAIAEAADAKLSAASHVAGLRAKADHQLALIRRRT